MVVVTDDDDLSGVLRGGGNPYDCHLIFAKHTSQGDYKLSNDY